MDPRLRQRMQETPVESRSRLSANFVGVENALPRIWSSSMMEYPILDRVTSFLGRSNPFTRAADPSVNNVWLLDNTAFRPVHVYPHRPQPFQAEFVACYFVKSSRQDIGKFVASIADQIGLDGSLGPDQDAATRRTIAERVQPFVDQIAIARTLNITIPNPSGTLTPTLGPSESNGVSSQIAITGDPPNLQPIQPYASAHFQPPVQMTTYFAPPVSSAWAIISDIDDTIKITKTTSPIGILRTTFADTPTPIDGMPELYKHIVSRLSPSQSTDPVNYFYLSASPYNLYPFLRTFLRTYYPPGQLILRDNSWMDLGGLLKSFTQGVQAYKVDRMEKIHSWLPKRKFLCIGDSTQSDPEAYAEMYHRYPGWIGAIFIRRVLDAGGLGEKNKDERFEKAFKDVPKGVWLVFETTEDLHRSVDELAARGTGS
jgi:hypothetical protein